MKHTRTKPDKHGQTSRKRERDSTPIFGKTMDLLFQKNTPLMKQRGGGLLASIYQMYRHQCQRCWFGLLRHGGKYKQTKALLDVLKNTSVTGGILFTIQYKKYTHSRGKSNKTPVVLKQKMCDKTHISLFKAEECLLLRLDGWVNCSRLNRYSIPPHTHDLWTLEDKQTVLLSEHWWRSF